MLTSPPDPLGHGSVDGVLIETTGLADPAPVALNFRRRLVNQHLCLGGILTLVDAKHIVQHLEEEKPEGVENEAVEQIAFAERILLSRCDLESEEELANVDRRIRAVSAIVPILRTMNSEVDMDSFLAFYRAAQIGVWVLQGPGFAAGVGW